LGGKEGKSKEGKRLFASNEKKKGGEARKELYQQIEERKRRLRVALKSEGGTKLAQFLVGEARKVKNGTSRRN